MCPEFHMVEGYSMQHAVMHSHVLNMELNVWVLYPFTSKNNSTSKALLGGLSVITPDLIKGKVRITRLHSILHQIFYNSTRNGYVLPWNWNQSNPCTTTYHDHPCSQTPGKSNMLISKAPILSLPLQLGFFALSDCWKMYIYSIPHPLWIFEQGHHIQKTPYIQQIQATSSILVLQWVWRMDIVHGHLTIGSVPGEAMERSNANWKIRLPDPPGNKEQKDVQYRICIYKNKYIQILYYICIICI